MQDRFKDQAHLLRVAGLFVAALLVFLLLKTLLVPADFGRYGHYRAGALDDNRAHPVVYAGRAACAACHEDAAAALAKGRHATVGCEACHGALGTHAEAADPVQAKPARPDARLCPVCHAAEVAKPTGFSQVRADHADAGTCLECHQAHQPGV